jgi:2-dehydropantoate 2-reductase
MGCLHAAWLARAGVSVALLDYHPERAHELNRHGVTVASSEDDTEASLIPYAVPCTTDPSTLGRPELVIVLTKAYATTHAALEAELLVGADTTVLTLQNGLGNWEKLAQVFPPTQVLAGTTSTGATSLGPGQVRLAGWGTITLGSPTGQVERTQRAAQLLGEGELEVEVAADVEAVLWRKAIVNAAVNPLGSLTQRRNGELLQYPELWSLLEAVAREAHTVALAQGLALGNLDPVALVEQVCLQTAENQCSMLQDVLAGRRTEIHEINGELVRRAYLSNTPVPLNTALVALVAALSQEPGAD